MNGSENGYASALFFALVSLCGAWQLGDIEGVIFGGVGALFAAISLRMALNKSAQAAEEDHQRMEIQFQQLRTKIIETSNASINAMNSLNDVTQLLQENLQRMNGKQSDADNLTKLSRSIDTINSTIGRLEENSAALHSELEKIPIALNSEFEKVPAALSSELEKIPVEISSELEKVLASLSSEFKKIPAAVQPQAKISFGEEFKALLEIEETNKSNLQTSLKILHVIAQIIRNSPFLQELEKINASLENLNAKDNLDALKSSIDEVQKNLAAFVNLNGEFAESFTTNFEQLNAKLDTDAAQKNLSALVKINSDFSKNFTTTFEQLNAKIDTDAAQKVDIADALNELKFSLDALKNSADDAQKNLFELVKINGDFAQNFATTFEQLNAKIDSADAFNELKISMDALKDSADEAQKNLAELVKINSDLSKGFTTTLDDLRLDMAKLSAKLETLKESSGRKSRRGDR